MARVAARAAPGLNHPHANGEPIATRAAGSPWRRRARNGALGPRGAPPLELRTLDGQPLALADLRGKVVLVNFWATWCEPCVEEMPSLQRLRDRLGAARCEVLAVNYQEGEPRIRAFLQKVPLDLPIVRDTDGGVARAWKVRIFPTTFVVDADQSIRYLLTGGLDWAEPAVERRIRALLPR